MSERLDKERQELLEPERIELAIAKIQELGYKVTFRDAHSIKFKFNGSDVTYFPYSGWASGKTIKDGRGLNNLLKQLPKQPLL